MQSQEHHLSITRCDPTTSPKVKKLKEEAGVQ